MSSSTRWFPQWETIDVNSPPGGPPAATIRQPDAAPLPHFGFVAVWELAGPDGEDSSAPGDDSCRRMA